MSKWLEWLTLRQWMALVAGGCAAVLAFALYLQHVVGLEPCPMCIVQRYALVLTGLSALLVALSPWRPVWWIGGALALLSAGFGAFVAARQSWLQWFPPETVSCGRDFYGMIETLPLRRAIPMIFRGSGDCTRIDWTFLGLSIANWSFVAFTLLAVLFCVLLWRLRRTGSAAPTGALRGA